MKPFRIFLDGQELLGWTSARLRRAKNEMTGSLTVNIFMNYIPEKPIAVTATRGRQVTVYVGGQLAFTGVMDKRKGRSVKNAKASANPDEASIDGGESGISRSIGSQGYQVTLTARGKTKYLIDSSHQHPTTNILDTDNRKLTETLTKDWQVELDWQAATIKLPIVRLNDGSTVFDELTKVSNDTCLFFYETREGKLRAIDQPGAQMGEDLILGENILTFSGEQSEEQANSRITIKGQRTDPKVWGKDAIIDAVRSLDDNWVKSNIPLTIQYYGDATPENLERRGKFEADKRSAKSKQVTIEVFHVQSRTGQPWDIGTLHYTEVPSEGLFDVLECIELEYQVEAEDQLTTTLTLAPPPSQGVSGGAGQGIGGLLTSSIPGLLDAAVRGVARRTQLGVSLVAGQFPASWSGADLVSVVTSVATSLVTQNLLLQDDVKQPLPLTLPENV